MQWTPLLVAALLLVVSVCAQDASNAGSAAAAAAAGGSASAATTSGSAAKETSTKRKPRSILQACRKELPTLCKDRKDAMRCLSTKAAEVKDPVCAEWLNARASCNKFLKDNNKCPAKENSRVCLRNIAKEELPAACSDSDYYKSVKLFGAFRRRRDLNTRQPKSNAV